MMVRLHDIVSASPSQISTTLGDESIVLELQAGTYFGVNDVGTAVWKFLQQPRPVADVIAHVLQRYEVSAEQAEAEVLAFLEELTKRNLVSVNSRS
jgi:hypothetical protein